MKNTCSAMENEDELAIHDLINAVRFASSNNISLGGIEVPEIRWYSNNDIAELTNSVRQENSSFLSSNFFQFRGQETLTEDIPVSSEPQIESGESEEAIQVNEDVIPDSSLAEQLERISELFLKGLLTEEEFTAAKERLINQ